MMKAGKSIENELTLKALLRGGGFVFSPAFGFGDPLKNVRRLVRTVVACSLDRKIVPADIVARSEIREEREAAAEIERQRRLDYEAQQVERELAALDETNE